MSRRIVVVGGEGRLGKALVRLYSPRYEVLSLARPEIDLSKLGSLRSRLQNEVFDTVINCAAMTNVDYCETNEDEARTVNAGAVRELAAVCTENGARFLNISTDYVFDGSKAGPYTESDEAMPASVYGASKREGEIAANEVSPEHLSVRVSWVFGPDRPSFVDQVLKRALETDDLSAVADKWSSPTFTHDLAAWLEPLFTQHRLVGGVMHLCNSGATTWRDYAEFALQCAAELGAPVKGTSVRPLKLSDMKAFVAVRPVNSVMATGAFEALTGIHPRPWQDAVRDYLANFAPVLHPA